MCHSVRGCSSYRCISAFLICALALEQTACAAYTALTIPGEVPDESVAVGMQRAKVEELLGEHETFSEFTDPTGETVKYKYIDGVHQASKARIVIYIAGDIFLLFLPELIFWPIELYAKQEMQRLGTAYYDHGNAILYWTVSRYYSQGEVLFAVGVLPAEDRSPAQTGATTSEGAVQPAPTDAQSPALPSASSGGAAGESAKPEN